MEREYDLFDRIQIVVEEVNSLTSLSALPPSADHGFFLQSWVCCLPYLWVPILILENLKRCREN